MFPLLALNRLLNVLIDFSNIECSLAWYEFGPTLGSYSDMRFSLKRAAACPLKAGLLLLKLLADIMLPFTVIGSGIELIVVEYVPGPRWPL